MYAQPGDRYMNARLSGSSALRLAQGGMSLSNAAVLVAVFAALGAPAQADVLSYTTTTAKGDVVLTSVTVNRGRGPVVFDAARLIRVTVTHFSSTAAALATPPGAGPPSPGSRGTLLRDLRLNSGLLNPGGQDERLTRDPRPSTGSGRHEPVECRRLSDAAA